MCFYIYSKHYGLIFKGYHIIFTRSPPFFILCTFPLFFSQEHFACVLLIENMCLKNELIWRKTRTTINFDIYYDSCKAVKKAISKENQN